MAIEGEAIDASAVSLTELKEADGEVTDADKARCASVEKYRA